MIARQAWQKYLRSHLFKFAAAALIICIGIIVYAKSSRHSTGAFALAEDFPRGALVYAQFRDLPALVKRWNESMLKQQYLNSINFQQFRQRHLALRLVERWEEFNSALGFSLDDATVTESTENRAAIAVYDIGRLEMVFIAPLTEEKMALTKFFQSQEQFEQTELPDGTTYYHRDVEADRGRQQQKIVFAMLDGRFILATSESLLLRTLANIKGQVKKDRLADDPSFKSLSGEVIPHFATVWVDQTKLNDDWYFKHYWLMSNVEQLKGMRAGMFDLEIQDGKWIEHRNFLYAAKEAPKNSGISPQEAERISAFFPHEVPYVKLQSLNGDLAQAATLIRDTFLDGLQQGVKKKKTRWNWRSYDDSDFYAGEGNYWHEDSYSYLNRDYDMMIDDPDDARTGGDDQPDNSEAANEAERRSVESLQQIFKPTQPLLAATAASPHMSSGPLFVEFRKAMIFVLTNPANLNRQAFERAVSVAVQNRLLISGQAADLRWKSNEGTEQWRELEMPMLGWKLCYALRGRELIVANSAELLQAALNEKRAPQNLKAGPAAPVHDLTIIRFDQREQAFDQVMNKLDAPRIAAYWKERQQSGQSSNGKSQEFFSGNIASLLDVAAPVRQIKIKRSQLSGRLQEEIEITFK